jgi:dTDP-4-amino-4,6-dideoxygalactose transaminase
MQEKINFVNLDREHKDLEEELLLSLNNTLHSSDFINSTSLKTFESEFASYCGCKYSAGVGSGLDALVMLLKAHCIGPGDEVIVPAHTFIATWLAVSHVGAIPVPVDIDEKTFNINVDLIQNVINKNTKAVIAVHLYGQPAELDKIIKVSRENNLVVLEDAAQAHGALYKGKRIGSLKTDGCAFSFYPTKNLGAIGDGGAITTNNKVVCDKIKLLRNYGSLKKYNHEIIGFNSRLDEIQASILSIKLKKLDKWNKKRDFIAQRYSKEITNKKITLPLIVTGTHVWHLYVIRTQERDKLASYLAKKNIQSSIHYPNPPFKQKAYQDSYTKSYPVTSNICKEILSIPMDPFLQTNEVNRIIDALNNFV